MRRLLIPLALLLASPALAQRGGNNQPLKNYAETCTNYGNVTDGASCSGYPKQWCVNYDTNFIYACNPTTGVWDAVGSASGGSGGGTTIQVDSSGVQVVGAADTLNFNSDFSVTDSGGGTALIGVNDSNLSVQLSSAIGTLSVAKGGTGSPGDAALARSNLGAAKSGSNGDITALTNLTTPLGLAFGGLGITSATGLDDAVPLGQSGGLTVAWSTIPNCTTGNQLLYDTSTNSFGCEADGASGTGTIKDIQNAGALLGSSGSGTTLNFTNDTAAGATGAFDAAGTGATKTITLHQTGSGTRVVDTNYTITGGQGLTAGGALSGTNLNLATASTEFSFLNDGNATNLTCATLQGAGSAQVLDSGLFQYCDGAAALKYAALGDSAGASLTGDKAAGFFPVAATAADALEVTRGGTGAISFGVSGQVIFNDGGNQGVDETGSSFTYNKTTDVLTVGSVSTYGAADNARYLELQRDSADVTAPAAEFTRLYFSGASAGSEVGKYRLSSGTVMQLATLTGTETFTNKTLTAPIETGKIDRNNTSVDDDDCTGEQGLWWYDTTDSQFEFCNANSGAPATVGGAGAGTITNVWQCSSGDCSTITATTGDTLNAQSADGLGIPYGAAPTVDANGEVAIDSTADQVVYESGGVVKALSNVRQACAVLETLVSTDDNYEFFMAEAAATVVSVGCRCRGTCTPTLATFTLEDRGGNAMTITGTNPTCATTGDSTFAAVTAGNTINAGEGVAFDVTNTPTTGDTYTICIRYTLDRQ